MYEQQTDNFNSEEGRCRGGDCCGHSAPVQLIVWVALQKLRDKLGVSLVLTCGFRCQKHNRTLGSKDTSQHIKGLAVDVIIPEGIDHMVLVEECKKLFKGVGYYKSKNFIHLDLRQGRRATWKG